MSVKTEHRLSITTYWRWLTKYWWLALLYLGVGLTAAYLHFQSLPRWYQSQVIFVVNPEAYNQGLLIRSDEIVSGNAPSSASKPRIAEPELRISYWLNSDDFARKVTAMLFDEVTDEALFQVRRHLHYYRYQNDRFHAIHWHAATPQASKQQLQMILEMLETELLKERINELELQISKATQLASSPWPSEARAELQQNISMLRTRLAMVTSDAFRLIQPTTDVTASPNPIYPQRIQVMLVAMFWWCAVGVTLLHFWLAKRWLARRKP
ncbi:hypothetical protein [Pseudidiomarina sp.]|uniref:hypothetical protein n=1 Tax=Pseudidiomarina sp. TaxID=2081707 RepID=UPI003A977DA6